MDFGYILYMWDMFKVPNDILYKFNTQGGDNYEWY